MSFGEALKYLAERAGIELRRRAPRTTGGGVETDDLRQANEAAARYFRHVLAQSDLPGQDCTINQNNQ